MPQTVLFLCTGNYYRSRYAEILFNSLAAKHNLDWVADSCGLRLEAANPGPISRFTVNALQKLQIQLQDPIRYPRPLTLADLESADHVVAVKEAEHRPLLSQAFPEWLERVEFWKVDDVDCAVPEVAIPELHLLVTELFDRLAKLPNR